MSFNSRADSIPSVEIRIPISATAKFMRMLHYLLQSIEVFGGPIAKSAHCIASISRDTKKRDLRPEYPWIEEYSLELRWIDEELYNQYEYDGTGLDRFDIESEADIVLLADADILITGDFDDVILQSNKTQEMLGFIAHVSPFDTQKFGHIPSEIWWKRLFAMAGLQTPPLDYIHTGWGLMTEEPNHKVCPEYFNYGFILSPRKYLEQMADSFFDELRIVDRVLETWFKSQIANTLSISRYLIPCNTLPINYNFPLHVPADGIRELNPDPMGKDELTDIKVFHYLGYGEFNKDQFATKEKLRNAIYRPDLSEAGRFFSQKLIQVQESLQS